MQPVAQICSLLRATYFAFVIHELFLSNRKLHPENFDDYLSSGALFCWYLKKKIMIYQIGKVKVGALIFSSDSVMYFHPNSPGGSSSQTIFYQ